MRGGCFLEIPTSLSAFPWDSPCAFWRAFIPKNAKIIIKQIAKNHINYRNELTPSNRRAVSIRPLPQSVLDVPGAQHPSGGTGPPAAKMQSIRKKYRKIGK